MPAASGGPRPLEADVALRALAAWVPSCRAAFPPAPLVETWWGLLESERLVGVAGVRRWGRVGLLTALAVAPEARRRGHGSQLLEAAAGALVAADCAVIGCDTADGLDAVAFLSRRGWRLGRPTLALERATRGEDVPLPRGARVVSGPAPQLADAERLARLCADVDADLDLSDWIRALVATPSVDLLLLEAAVGEGEGGELEGLALVPRGAAGEPLVAPQVLLGGSDAAALERLSLSLGALARARQQPVVQLVVGGRYHEAVRGLLELGYRPTASRQRLTLAGHPERADTRRAVLASW